MNLPSFIQNIVSKLKPHHNSDFYKRVKAAIKTDGVAYVNLKDLANKDLGGFERIRIITGATYDRVNRDETYHIFSPYDHQSYTYTYSPEESPTAPLRSAGDFRGMVPDQIENWSLASSYAIKAMSIHRAIEWVVGSNSEGDLLTLFSGSRPCCSSNLNDGEIINFHVLDSETLEFKRMVHWNYTKGRLWNSMMNPVATGKPILSAWVFGKDPENKVSEWVAFSQEQAEQDHLNLKGRWGSVCIDDFKYGDIVTTPTWVGMVIGECTSEKEHCSLILVDYPSGRNEGQIKYSVHPINKVSSLKDLFVTTT